MEYNNRFTMKDLFMNPQLSNIFPQFPRGGALKNVYSGTEIERRIKEYLKNVLKGAMTGQDEMLVRGKHGTILRHVQRFKAVIEQFFNNIPAVVMNLRRNTKLYTPFTSISELADISSATKKREMMKIALDNLTYNPDFGAPFGIRSSQLLNFKKRQADWMEKVGYKETM